MKEIKNENEPRPKIDEIKTESRPDKTKKGVHQDQNCVKSISKIDETETENRWDKDQKSSRRSKMD